MVASAKNVTCESMPTSQSKKYRNCPDILGDIPKAQKGFGTLKTHKNAFGISQLFWDIPKRPNPFGISQKGCFLEVIAQGRTKGAYSRNGSDDHAVSAEAAHITSNLPI